jgi:hypothetical protein
MECDRYYTEGRWTDLIETWEDWTGTWYLVLYLVQVYQVHTRYLVPGTYHTCTPLTGQDPEIPVSGTLGTCLQESTGWCSFATGKKQEQAGGRSSCDCTSSHVVAASSGNEIISLHYYYW